MNDFSESHKVELRIGRLNPMKETKMLKKTECPAGIPVGHRLAIEILRKYGLFKEQVLQKNLKEFKLRQ